MDKYYINQEILEKVNGIKSADELRAVAKESNIDMNEEELAKVYRLLTIEDVENINDEELENVTGGSYMRNCRTYSSDTNSEGRHPLIVTKRNWCDLYEHNYAYDIDSAHVCVHCLHFDSYGIEERQDILTCYCTKRSDEDDPLNPR